jgi:hypothetical protein
MPSSDRETIVFYRQDDPHVFLPPIQSASLDDEMEKTYDSLPRVVRVLVHWRFQIRYRLGLERLSTTLPVSSEGASP